MATLNALTSLGVGLSLRNECIEIYGGRIRPKTNIINCYESGTTLRFIAGITSLINDYFIITGHGSLLRRPVGELVNALNELGGRALCVGGYPPVITLGRIRGGMAVVRGDVSSQFISSLLIISPLADEEVTLRIPHLESKPYVLMTLDVQRSFGVSIKYVDYGESLEFRITPSKYTPTTFNVEGDWSSTSYLLVGAAISGSIRVYGINIKSIQADEEILNVLRAAGATVLTGGDWVEVSSSKLEGFEFDVRNSPDLLPVLSALAAVSKGITVIRGIGRCRFKESDRVESVVANLRRLGVVVKVVNDELVIEGVEQVKGGIIDSYGDHRIAMAFSLLSLKSSNGLVINDPLTVSKSYPNFWRDLRLLGMSVEVIGDV